MRKSIAIFHFIVVHSLFFKFPCKHSRLSMSYRFNNFFNHVDTYAENIFLYVTSGGIKAAQAPSTNEAQKEKAALAEVESDSEDEVVDGGEEGG